MSAPVKWLSCIVMCAGTALADPAPRTLEGWVFPGEYESHQAMWMLWPTFEYKAGFPSTDPMSEMILAMSGHTQVNLAVQDDADEQGARELLLAKGVPLEHVHFFQLEHGDIWARDMGPQFTRSDSGRLRINDWNFNMWGHEEPASDASTFEEGFDRSVAVAIDVPAIDASVGPGGARFIHEGGGVTHNGQGTMIAVESVVMQRNLGPGRFCGGQAPVTDYDQPNTYAPNADWPACRALVEQEYRRMLGARKVIWLPTGVVEDNGTFRGPLAPHIHVPRFKGIDVPHSGVYTVFTTNGHVDEVVRFVAPNKVILAQEPQPSGSARTPAEMLVRWMRQRNHERLERVRDILSRATTQSGESIEIIHIPTPEPTLEVFEPGDGTYDYFAAYDQWEDGSSVPEVMLGVWAASYVNYVPTNDLVLVSSYWRPGLSLQVWLKDFEAREALQKAFPGRRVVQIDAANVNRGGGGMNCITQQQPASRNFDRLCPWAKVRVGVDGATVYMHPSRGRSLGSVTRLSSFGDDIYLKRLGASGEWIRVQVVGVTRLAGATGWIAAADIESAGERCPNVYSVN